MRSEVKVVFGPQREINLSVDASEVLSFEAARRWLDEQFVQHACEPMRGSGKVLIADKLLAIAATVGPEAFADAAWALDYARAASGVLSKAMLTVDVPGLAVTF